MITLEKFTELAHRTASRYSHRSDPARAFYTFSPEALADFHRQVCSEAEALAAVPARLVPDIESLTDKISDLLSGTYHCMRVWEAWHVGTMSQDDFEPVDESETPREIAEEIHAMLAAATKPVAQPSDARVESILQEVDYGARHGWPTETLIRLTGMWSAKLLAEDAQAKPEQAAQPNCWCQTCRPITLDDMRMVVCPDCGNKRCPKANDHRNACTNSNDPGQPGSAYPGPVDQPAQQERQPMTRNCPECHNADSWGIADKEFCVRCTPTEDGNGSLFSPLNERRFRGIRKD